MPTRRQFEMTVIVVILLGPALSMVHLWLKKHLATTASAAGADVAFVADQVL
jgi:hypothetical protein